MCLPNFMSFMMIILLRLLVIPTRWIPSWTNLKPLHNGCTKTHKRITPTLSQHIGMIHPRPNPSTPNLQLAKNHVLMKPQHHPAQMTLPPEEALHLLPLTSAHEGAPLHLKCITLRMYQNPCDHKLWLALSNTRQRQHFQSRPLRCPTCFGLNIRRNLSPALASPRNVSSR